MLHDKRFEPSIQVFDASARVKSGRVAPKPKREVLESGKSTRQYKNTVQRFLKLDKFI